MQKSQKIVLSMISLGYLFGLCLLIWPRIIVAIFMFLQRFNINVTIKSEIFIYYYGIALLVVTAFILLLILLRPTQLPDILLKQSKEGKLALSNYGIKQFIKTQLSGEDLSNIQVKIKNTRRKREFYISADAVYQRATVADLPRITKNLTTKLTDLLAGVSDIPIKVDIQVNQQSNARRKVTRVI
ncbi:alkaline shock response membrane anchor protein AmaP [Leuconostoc miyukkimchii]|uniref:alkaline shock response membrane anchor protein AmaP n=1 Tax=Leuconostoc miyukkimchii TaxID=910540 RepID=UPI001C7CBC7B|nr:alkaline shock response membrane anchor protein AmaP [Leuconostoc miyukkimchii]